MVDFESKAGEIKKSEIDFSKIYASKQNALDGINNVTVTDSNASWNTGDLTYKISDDNQTVIISNGGVPIGFTTVDALKDVANSGALNSGELLPAEKLIVDKDAYQSKMDDTLENTGSPIHQEEAPAPELKPEYNEEPAEEVETEMTGTNEPSTPTEDVTMQAEVQDTAAEEIAAETQQPPEPPVDVESLELESTVEAPEIPTGNGTIAYGVEAGGFVMPSVEQTEVVYKIIAAEGGSSNVTEALAIASTLINRARAGNWPGGNNIYGLATAPKQYVVYKSGAYLSANVTAEVRVALDSLFSSCQAGGATPFTYQSFRAPGVTDYSDNQPAGPSGNRYK